MKTTPSLFFIIWVTFSAFGQGRQLDFVENLGQFPEQVNFKADLYNGCVYLEDNSFTFVFHNPEDMDLIHHHLHSGVEENNSDGIDFIRSHAFKSHFLGSNSELETSHEFQRAGFYNYFIGNDRNKWASNVRRFGTITQHNLYDGVDLKVYSRGINLKYDFIVQPKADVSQIRFQHEGVNAVNIQNGSLILQTSIGTIIENKPYAYQVDLNGIRQEVACEYALLDGIVSFVFPEGYDQKNTLVIDPILVAATLSGTSIGANYGHTAAYDENGNIFAGARTFSGAVYPVTTGAYQTTFGGGITDIAISKFNPDGSNLIYATYLGGTDDDFPHSIITDPSGELWVLGSSKSNDFPVSANAYQNSSGGFEDFVISHLSSDGSMLIGSTYLGGGNTDGENNMTTNYEDLFRSEIIVDDQGNCYVASCTNSVDFPVTPGAYQSSYGGNISDGVVFSLNSDMSTLNWSTYLGGPGGDACFGLHLDVNGDVYVCGVTIGIFIPLTGYLSSPQGNQDAFIVKLSSDGNSVLGGTFFGGSGTGAVDNAFFIDIGGSGNVFIYGTGNAIPVTQGLYTDAGSTQYIASFTSDLDSLNYSTIVGGFFLIPHAFMVDQDDRIYYTGSNPNSNSGAPTTIDSIQGTGAFYVGVLDPGATGLYYGTYYGGIHVHGGTSRFHPDGILYQVVCHEDAFGPFQTTPGAWADTSSTWDVGVFKIDFEIASLSMEDLDDPTGISLVPNPTSGIVYIEGLDHAIKEIIVLNTSGVECPIEMLPNGSFNTSHLASGVYFVSIRQKEASVVLPLVVQ